MQERFLGRLLLQGQTCQDPVGTGQGCQITYLSVKTGHQASGRTVFVVGNRFSHRPRKFSLMEAIGWAPMCARMELQAAELQRVRD